MPYTYDVTQPDANAMSRVRTLSHDTEETDWSPDDALITYWLDQHGSNEIRASLEAGRYLRNKWREKHPESRSVIGQTAAVATNPYDEVVVDLERILAASGRAGLSMYGIRRSEISEIESDRDVVRSFSAVGGDRNC